MFAIPTLRFMDWIGNAHHGITLLYNYQSKFQWDKAWLNCRMLEDQFESIPSTGSLIV